MISTVYTKTQYNRVPDIRGGINEQLLCSVQTKKIGQNSLRITLWCNLIPITYPNNCLLVTLFKNRKSRILVCKKNTN